MFAKSIIDSDSFLNLPLTAQALYFHICMRADDDGFVNNPVVIQRMVGASHKEMDILLAKNYLILFDSGIVLVKHWKIHNYIRSDRYKPTHYTDEKNTVTLSNSNIYEILP